MSELNFLTVMPVDPSRAIQITEDNIGPLVNFLNRAIWDFYFELRTNYKGMPIIRWVGMNDDYPRKWANIGWWIIIDDDNTTFRALSSIDDHYAQVADI